MDKFITRNPRNSSEPVAKKSRQGFEAKDLISDPGLRHPISSYPFDERDVVRRLYLIAGPCQPHCHDFPWIGEGSSKRCFRSEWFNTYPWLEYSIAKNAAYCLPCYLYPSPKSDEAFISNGFVTFSRRDKFTKHVGKHSSTHNFAQMKCDNLMNDKTHLDTLVRRHPNEITDAYRTRLGASIDTVRILIHQALAFRGHNETENSTNRGNFLELLNWLADHNEEINKVVLNNAPANVKLTSPQIQKQIIYAISSLTTEAIISDMEDDVFTILVDESRDCSKREQMAVLVRYVNREGFIMERIIGLVEVSDTRAISLKTALEDFLCQYGLTLDRLRGQGYDGASNMQGNLKGLKTLILNENPCAYYIHCFAHQLQLVLVKVSKTHPLVELLFDSITAIMNCVGGSCQRMDLVRAKELERVAKGLDTGEIISGTGIISII